MTPLFLPILFQLTWVDFLIGEMLSLFLKEKPALFDDFAPLKAHVATVMGQGNLKAYIDGRKFDDGLFNFEV